MGELKNLRVLCLLVIQLAVVGDGEFEVDGLDANTHITCGECPVKPVNTTDAVGRVWGGFLHGLLVSGGVFDDALGDVVHGTGRCERGKRVLRILPTVATVYGRADDSTLAQPVIPGLSGVVLVVTSRLRQEDKLIGGAIGALNGELQLKLGAEDLDFAILVGKIRHVLVRTGLADRAVRASGNVEAGKLDVR